jgi:hypothetical protein
MMTLIRGVKALFPCPKCLVPKEFLSNLNQKFPLQTQEQSWEAYKVACGKLTKAAGEKYLKGFGLRHVKVITLILL